ncbi:ketosteroid isomerase-like protein [Variovorax boronicumulans]|jgi:ketosteroid isomerase-like protein|uniref:nuclear transport factor 2 family protein n=1 Tax=Variovorax boronicumulans TaxID=436515 RepID=UPI00277FDA09|nr:nuclear transport factor 2 family protein [Variovorax boronicumulans]MDQ0080348.1 ketosteroid isomerase-like protein [Variovorax boronicumulans]
MPTPERLESFIAAVEGGAHAKAIEDYYTEDATMRENQAEPRRGRSTLVAQESAVLDRTESVVSTCVRPVLVNGDHVAIHWIFEFTFKGGNKMRMEEIAWQRWEGERIAEEQFFYDPAQKKPG